MINFSRIPVFKQPSIFLDGDSIDASCMYENALCLEGVELSSLVIRNESYIIETAMYHSSDKHRLHYLMEGALDVIFDKVKEFLGKILGAVKIVADKTDVYFMNMMGRVDDWVKIMEPKIKDAKKAKESPNITFQMYDWNTSYVFGEMCKDVCDGIKGSDTFLKNLAKDGNGSMNATELVAMAKKLGESEAASMKKTTTEHARVNYKQGDVVDSSVATRYKARFGADSVETTQGSDGRNVYTIRRSGTLEDGSKPTNRDDVEAQHDVGHLGAVIDKLKDATEKLQQKTDSLTEDVCQSMGINSITNPDNIGEYIANLMNKAHNGKDVSSISIHSRVDEMLSAVKDSGKCRDGMVNAYKNHLDALNVLAKSLEDLNPSKAKTSNFEGRKDEGATLLKEYWRKRIVYKTNCTNLVERITNASKNANLTAIKNMISDYMKALTVYVNGTSSKSKDESKSE